MKRVSLIILIATLLTACGSGNARKILGIEKNAPDEFRVISKAPLVLPPNFNLRPPKPGAKSLNHRNISEQTKEILLGSDNQNLPERSRGEQLLINKTQGNIDPDIRKTLAEENRLAEQSVKEKGFFDKISGFTKGEEKDPIVDAKKEKERIEENKSENKTITGEDAAEINKESEGGFLGRLFGR